MEYNDVHIWLQEISNTLSSLHISIWIIDDSKRLKWANEWVTNNYGPLEKIQGNLCSDVLPYYDELRIHLLLDRVFQTGNMEKFIFPKKIAQDRQEEYFRYLFYPNKTANGQVSFVVVLLMPLTDTERSQWNLQKFESHLANLAQTSADAIIGLDREGYIQFWNMGAETIFGHSAHEVLGRYPDFLLTEKRRKEGELAWLLKTTDDQGAIVNYETERVTKDGKVFIAEITRTALYDEEGNIVGSSAVIKDITERKKIEQELKLTIEELSKLNQIADYLHSSKDLNEILRLTLVSVTAGEGFQYNRAFLLLVNHDTSVLTGHLAVGPGSPEEASRIWSNLGRNQPLEYVLNVYKHKIGETDKEVNRIVRQMWYPLSDNSQVLVRVLNTMNPIIVYRNTTQDNSELDVLKRLKTDVAAIIPLFGRNLKIGILIVDNNISHHPIQEESLGGLRLFGNQAGLAIENAMLYQRLSDQLEELKTTYADLEKSEARLMKAERLATIGELTARVAHEIRNPLISIGGFTRALLRESCHNDNHTGYLKIIMVETARLEKILNNFMAFARPESVLEKKPGNINKIIDETMILVKEELETNHIEFKRQLDKKIPNILLGQTEMVQVFLNLFRNAIQAMKENGTLSIRSYVDNNRVKVEITDTGEGIDPEIRDKIFLPFFTTKSHGTGLGLAVTKQILSQHNCNLRVWSEKQGGATFLLDFPIFANTDSSDMISHSVNSTE